MALHFFRTRWTYTRLQTDDASPNTSSSKARPSLLAILTSKQLRLAVSVVAGLLLLTVVVRSRDWITSIRLSSPDTHFEASPTQKDASPTLHTALPSAPPTPGPSAKSNADQHQVDWSRFAYVQYVTDGHYLCNSVMFFERLQHVQSNADRVMMYPSNMLLDPEAQEGISDDAKLLILARDKYNVKLTPITIQHRQSSDRKS